MESTNTKSPESPPQDGPSWFERPRNINAMILGLFALGAGLVLADLFYENPHPHFPVETSFGFQAWFGFVAFIVVVFLGRLLRVFVRRPEDFYDR